ncbi:DUF5615 family PIN-like protein [Pedococcus bigeumensis]|uniref:VapC45 PIN like domain-containing protein n=1 Tax=Pedococcus bigeumensis TaxID=433644 RepID=A0A502CUY1_9MICO|nr:DUF5615 family PIN-like protein [Pedococcus bigeumensis]TPG17047.1 hypothetical protein EAH86_09735 [Pedococcus bigeumensis]
MKVLLDEDVPQPVIRLVAHLLRGHEVKHVSELAWLGKKDVPLIGDAARRGFRVFVTQNIGQFNVPAECDAIKRSGMHHISYEVPAGLKGLGLASGALCAAIHPIVAELDKVQPQRIVKIVSLDSSRRRYEVSDPAVDPPSAYWT